MCFRPASPYPTVNEPGASPCNTIPYADAGSAYKTALTLIQNQQWPEALQQLEFVAEQLPNSPSTKIQIAICLEKIGQPHQAKKILSESKALKGTDIYCSTYNNIQNAIDAESRANRFCQAGFKKLKEGAYSEAADNFYKALDEYSNASHAYRGLGHIFYAQNERSAAIEALNQAIAIEPNDIISRRLIAEILIHESEGISSAINHLNFVIEKNPNCVIAILQRAEAYRRIGLHHQALNDLRPLVKQLRDTRAEDPSLYTSNYAFALSRSAFCLYNINPQQNQKRAITLYQEAIQHFPTDPFPYLGLSKIYETINGKQDLASIYRQQAMDIFHQESAANDSN